MDSSDPVALQIQRLEARVAELRARDQERDACALREAELEVEIEAMRSRLDDRGIGDERRGRSPLDDLRIASPCNAVWSEMRGDARVRHCGACNKNVYDLGAMTRREAERLLAEKEAPCVRFYQRGDGTVMTSDCPVGRRRLRVRRVIAATGVAGVLTALALVAQGPAPTARAAACGLGAARNAAERAAASSRRGEPEAPNYENMRGVIMGAAPARVMQKLTPPPAKTTAPATTPRGGEST